jgi:cobalt/nickel transport system permease protein
VAKIEAAFFDIGRLDRLSAEDSWVHRLDPRAKILTTIVFLVAVVSFPKYEISALLPFAFYPVFLAGSGRVPFGFVGKKIIAVAPFAFLVGVWNPFLDRNVLLTLGSLHISGGWLSFASILVRFALTVGTAFILIAVTSFQGLCLGLQRLGMPQVMTVQLLFLYRYLFVLGEEALHMTRARSLRTFGSRGKELRIYAHVVGHLLLRTLDRAQRVYRAMLSRGFDGEVRLLRTARFGTTEVLFTLGWSAAFVALRLVNLPQLLGTLLTGSAP